MKFFLMSIFFFLYRTLTLSREIRILQLNHYQISRQIEYLMTRKYSQSKLLARLIVHIPFLILCFVPTCGNDLFTMLLIVYIYISFKFTQLDDTRNSLKYTRRVQRLYLLLYFLYTFLLFVAYTSDFFILGAILLMMVNKEIVFLANLIITPLEKGIQKFYMGRAKKILKDNTQLMKLGIVGSYGKTSTKNIVYHLLKENYLCLKSQSSFNNVMGNTLTIRKELKRIHDIFICEMGSDHVGEIEKLIKFIEPQYVVITSVGNQHLNTFHTQENIIYEKTSPLLFLKKNDIAFLNLDNDFIKQNINLGCCKKITYGNSEECNFHLKSYQLSEWGSQFIISFQGRDTSFKTSLLGYYNIMNILAGICVAHTLEVPMVILQRLCASMKPVEHRLQPIDKGHYTLIDNAYNSNTKSFKNSLQILKKIEKYTILITPGLVDLKNDASENELLMKDVSGCCDEVIIVGYLNREALTKGLKQNGFEKYHCLDTMEEALNFLENCKIYDFVALIENDIDKTLMNPKN